MAVDGGTGPITAPPENHEGAARPSPASAEAWAPRLLEAIKADDPEPVLDLYFPLDAFVALKAVAEPARYHRNLVRYFREDLHTEHERFPDVSSLVFDRFQMGRCTWQAAWSEGNRIPYWSCRHNWLHAKAGNTERRFELRVMINWGANWYITHLGPLRTFPTQQ